MLPWARKSGDRGLFIWGLFIRGGGRDPLENVGSLMALGEEIELRKVCQGSGGRLRVQVYADIVAVQALEALDFGLVGDRALKAT